MDKAAPRGLPRRPAAASPSREITAEAIKAFAAEFDPQPFHLDEAAAEGSFFGGLAASGWHTAALTMRMLADGGLPIAGGLIGAGGEIAWPRPTRPGDVLQRRERGRGGRALALAPRPRHGHRAVRDAEPARRGGAGAGLEGPRLPRGPESRRLFRAFHSPAKAV